ncbi:hypothetical protein V2P50_03160 [Mesomycoplasma hyorhinis]|uniref:hypothetical protein n=1 Tax=Mesomycoplasma hyorhinis TaxID=2100 RepID=UPI003DA5FBB3
MHLKKIFSLDFIEEGKNFKTLINENLKNSGNKSEKVANLYFNFTKTLIKDFFDANHNLSLTFNYPDSSKKIFLFVKDSQNITIKKGSYVWSIESDEFKNLPSDLQDNLIKFRKTFLQSETIETLNEDINWSLTEIEIQWKKY